MRAYRDGIKRKRDKIGMQYEASIWTHCEHADTPRDKRANPIIVTWCLLHLDNNIGIVRLSLGVSA